MTNSDYFFAYVLILFMYNNHVCMYIYANIALKYLYYQHAHVHNYYSRCDMVIKMLTNHLQCSRLEHM